MREAPFIVIFLIAHTVFFHMNSDCAHRILSHEFRLHTLHSFTWILIAHIAFFHMNSLAANLPCSLHNPLDCDCRALQEWIHIIQK